jgi:DNA methylase
MEICIGKDANTGLATFPPALVEPCILAGTSAKGCCAKCGAPWVRETERRDIGRKQKMSDGWDTGEGSHGTIHRTGREKGETGVPVMATMTTGWSPSCACAAAVVPSTVLDPFMGAGTTGLVADRLRRNCIGIELNKDYAKMAKSRIYKDAPKLFGLSGSYSIEEK